MLSLRQLVKQAADSPLYRGWDFTGIEHFGDRSWQALPTLTSAELSLDAEAVGAGADLLFHTSGTTGAPKLVRYSAEDLERVAELCARFAHLEGVGRDSRVMVLLPMGLWTVGRITVDGHRRAGAQVFPVDLHGGVVAWQHMADVIRPTVISSTPSVLAAWAPHYRGPRLELIETTGEALLHDERHRIEAAFGAFVYDAYGLSECVVGTECAVRDGYHYWPDATGVEVLHPDRNQPVPEGEEGELVLTSFMQARMPVLRYRSGDIGRVERVPCACGNEQPRVHLSGRIATTLNLPRAVKIDVDQFARLLEELEPGSRFRYKGMPGRPSAPHLGGAFRPLLEIETAGRSPKTRARVQPGLWSALPELAELVHEGELDLRWIEGGRGGRPFA